MLLPKRQKVTWGDEQFEVDVHRPIYVNQNLQFFTQGRVDRFEDTVCLRFIAAFSKELKIELQMHQEVFFELMGVPRAFGDGPLFYDAPITKVPGPVEY